MRRLFFVFALGIAFVFAAPWVARAESASKAPAAKDTTAKDTAAAEDAEIAGWVKRLDDAKARLEGAKQHLDQLHNAKGKGAARRYPRGDAKGKYLDDLKVTAAEYESARAELPKLIEQARRAGVGASVLEPYETAAEAAHADMSATDDEEEAAADEPMNDAGAAHEDSNPNHADDENPSSE